MTKDDSPRGSPKIAPADADPTNDALASAEPLMTLAGVLSLTVDGDRAAAPGHKHL